MISRWGFIGLISATPYFALICSQSRSICANFSLFYILHHVLTTTIRWQSTSLRTPSTSRVTLISYRCSPKRFLSLGCGMNLFIGVRVCCSSELLRGDFHALWGIYYALPSFILQPRHPSSPNHQYNQSDAVFSSADVVAGREMYNKLLNFEFCFNISQNYLMLYAATLVLVWIKRIVQCSYIICTTCSTFWVLCWCVFVQWDVQSHLDQR